MAVRKVAEIENYIGLSTDTKPTAPAGSTFHALNTGEKWISDGTNWVEDISGIYAISQALNL